MSIALLPISTNVLASNETSKGDTPSAVRFLVVTTNTQGRIGGLMEALPESLRAAMRDKAAQEDCNHEKGPLGIEHKVYTLRNDDPSLSYDYIVAVVDDCVHPVGDILSATIKWIVGFCQCYTENIPVITFPVPRTGANNRLAPEDMASIVQQALDSPYIQQSKADLLLVCMNRALHEALGTALSDQTQRK